jgi:hypothetical protein
MSELVVATSILDPGNRTTFEVKKAVPLDIGVAEKQHLEVNIINPGRIALSTSLIERYFDPVYAESWLTCHVAGLTIPPELQLSSRNTLLMADLKADGSELYGKGLAQIFSHRHCERQRSRPEIDKKFLHLFSSGFRQLEKEAFRFADRATEQDIKLSFDDAFELHLRPDDSWNFIAIDLEDEVGHDWSKDTLAQHQKRCAERVISQLRDIYRQL